MNDTKVYSRGTVLFREGEAGDCMYDIQSGCVGIYRDYDGPNEVKLADLYGGRVFGEMSVLDGAPRSATAVVLENGTCLTRITEESFLAYFKENPAKLLDITQQMCNRLRKTTKNYIEACQTVKEAREAEKSGKEKDSSLLARIKALCSFYADSGFYPYF